MRPTSRLRNTLHACGYRGPDPSSEGGIESPCVHSQFGGSTETVSPVAGGSPRRTERVISRSSSVDDGGLGSFQPFTTSVGVDLTPACSPRAIPVLILGK